MNKTHTTTNHQSMTVTFFDTELQTAVEADGVAFGNNLKMAGTADQGSEVTGCTMTFHSTARPGKPVYVPAEKRIYVDLPQQLYAEYLRVLQSGTLLKMTYEEVDGAPNARLYASFPLAKS